MTKVRARISTCITASPLSLASLHHVRAPALKQHGVALSDQRWCRARFNGSQSARCPTARYLHRQSVSPGRNKVQRMATPLTTIETQVKQRRRPHGADQGGVQARLPRQPVLHPGQISRRLRRSNDYYQALAYAVRDRLLRRWISTAAAYTKQGSRTVAYFSAEFLMGPHLGNNLINLGIYDEVRQAISELGLNFDELLHAGGRAGSRQRRPRPAGGVFHRFAGDAGDPGARLRHSLRVRHLPSGDRRRLADRERTDKWLRFGNPWEIARPEWAVEVKLGGYTEQYQDEHDRLRVRWVPHKNRRRRAVRHADPRLSHQHREHVAAVEGRGAGVVRLLRVQSRRLLRRGESESLVGEPEQGALSERRADAGQGAAARAAVLLRLLLAAGHVAHHARCRRSRSSASTRSSLRS